MTSGTSERPSSSPSQQPGNGFSILDMIEWSGNKLPDPVTLFALGTLLVMVLSFVGAKLDWRVTERLPQPILQDVIDADGNPVIDEETGKVAREPVLDPDTGEPMLTWEVVQQTREEIVTRIKLDDDGEPILDDETGHPMTEVVLGDDGEPLTRKVLTDEPRSHGVTNILTADGIFWALSSMVSNFVSFPPLGVVLVGMLGIGVAERTGLIRSLLKAFMLIVPGRLLTPSMVFIGIMSSLATDAGYVVLPPLAAALYKAVGRSPLVGLAAVFAGVSAGFNANLFITGLDPMLAEFSTIGAQVIDSDYVVNPASNWLFLIASTFVITLTGWFVTSRFVERRLNKRSPEDGGPSEPTAADLAEQQLKPEEFLGMAWAGLGALATVGVFLALILIPGMPLYGPGAVFDRWIEVIVPMLFFIFVVPGIVYGVYMKDVKNDKDVAKLFMESMAAMAPIIVLAFVAAQFIEHFQYSGLDRMLAMAGGQWLGQAGFGAAMLIVCFILLTLLFNLFMGSMSAKYAMFAPIFIPMFMLVGISPELTQAAYRIGDSVSNIITPLNAYLIIILVFMQKYVPKGGMGTLVATMFPYTVVFTIVWTAMLLVWMWLGLPLGIDGGLTYDLMN